MLRDLLDAPAGSVSLGLQSGVPLSAYVERLALACLEPAGWTDGELGSPYSVFNCVAPCLELWFLGAGPRECQALAPPAQKAVRRQDFATRRIGNNLLNSPPAPDPRRGSAG